MLRELGPSPTPAQIIEHLIEKEAITRETSLRYTIPFIFFERLPRGIECSVHDLEQQMSVELSLSRRQIRRYRDAAYRRRK